MSSHPGRWVALLGTATWGRCSALLMTVGVPGVRAAVREVPLAVKKAGEVLLAPEAWVLLVQAAWVFLAQEAWVLLLPEASVLLAQDAWLLWHRGLGLPVRPSWLQ